MENNELGKIKIYDTPTLLLSDIHIFANNYQIPVYLTAVNSNRKWSPLPETEKTSFAFFDFEGEVDIKLIFPSEITKLKIRPESSHIIPSVNGREVRFKISKADTYTIEYNDLVTTPIHIFANEMLETPKGNIRYIEPGIHKENIIAKSNEIIYVAGGAIVQGQIIANNTENVTICGRGIIDGSNFLPWTIHKAVPQINANNSDNLTIDGLIFIDSNCWALNLYQCKNLKINNIKIITARPNSDGISLQSCVSAIISNSFVRTWDDSLVIKNYSSINSNDIHFENIQIWTDLAQSCEIGYETNKANANNSEIYNISFNNITILHNFHKPVISIHNGDNAWIHNISYNNIIIEDAAMGHGDAKYNNQLIDFVIDFNSNWSSTKDRGKISDIRIENIKVLSGNFPPSRIHGYDSNHCVRNIKIINLEILKERIYNYKQAQFDINEFCESITFE